MKIKYKVFNIMLVAIIIVLLLIPLHEIKAQNDYYYSSEKKIELRKAKHAIVIQDLNIQKQFYYKILSLPNIKVKRVLGKNKNIFWLESSKSTNIIDYFNQLNIDVDNLHIHSIYYHVVSEFDTTWYVYADEFKVKFKNHVSRNEIDQINKNYNVNIVSISKYGRYILRNVSSSLYSTLEIANKYAELSAVEWSLPNFYIDFKPESIHDSLFDHQWYLHNTGQNGAVYGVDINVVPAWNITLGSNDIVVAVIDTGVESHEDFSEGQVISGYTANYLGAGQPIDSGAGHGQAVAGIIAARHNTKGVRGIANNVKIMPINILNDFSSSSDYADGIDFAWDMGADVLNNSWGVSSYYDDDIEEAIQRALTQGRNGKGAIVIKSAGNNGQFVTYPGTIPGVFVIGAVSSQNQKLWYSPPSPLIDIIAPSGDANNPYILDIVTMDRMGLMGYDEDNNHTVSQNGNYLLSFDGTSASAPQAAAVAALLLSINPNLEARAIGVNQNPEVQNILRNSATSYGVTNWAGFGRVNAYNALIYTIANHGAHLGKQMPQVTLPLYDDLALHEDVSLESGSNLTIESKSGTVTITAASGTVTIGGPGGAPKTAGDNHSGNEHSDNNGAPDERGISQNTPVQFSLSNNYPNPFNPTTVISYQLPAASQVTLKVFDMLGREVATLVNGRVAAGLHEVRFNASALSSGVYLYQIHAGTFTKTKKMLLIK